MSVISPAFCVPHPIQLCIKKKNYFFGGHGYEVKDDTNNGKFLFKVKSVNSLFSTKVVIYDAAGNPIVTLRPKGSSNRNRWQVFRGKSKAKKDIIFSARMSSLFQIHTNLDVFLANNTKEKLCDFKMNTSLTTKTCDIYGPSSALIAQMKRKGVFFGSNHLTVSVNPNVDYALIVALIIILEEILTSLGTSMFEALGNLASNLA